MIIVNIVGGMGNQMFQYAIGRHLALKNKTTLGLNNESFDRDRLRVFVLSKLKCQYSIVSLKQSLRQKYGTCNKIVIFGYGLFNKLTAKIIGKTFYVRKDFIKEKNFAYDNEILKKRGDLYLDGYWQSEKYFLEIREVLLKEFVPNELIKGENKKIADKISRMNSISIHIRRGDYVGNNLYANCSIDYYQKAVKYIGQKVSNPHLFIFSDDHQWVRNNLKFPYSSTIVDINDATTDYRDLRLMSMCKHNIIANSSFSWWGAWLNKNDHKIVVAPKSWFKSNQIDTSDLIPDDWKKLENDS